MPATVQLTPEPDSCVKSSTVGSCLYDPTHHPSLPGVINLQDTHNNAVEPIVVPEGLKVFINLAWDKAIPGSPPESEGVAQHARLDSEGENVLIPVALSPGRIVDDKAGKPSLVVDVIFGTSRRSRARTDKSFHLMLLERAIQCIESALGTGLSRDLRTPNIRSKGPLKTYTASIMPALQSRHTKPLIEEITSSSTIPSSVRRNGGTTGQNSRSATQNDGPSGQASPDTVETPAWSWRSVGDRVLFEISVPRMTRAMIASATLDIEPSRVMLSVPSTYALDISLNGIDASGRCADLNVDEATAEWRIAEGVLALMA